MAKLAQAEFILDMPQARSVAVVGNFNCWNPVLTPLERADRGCWKTTVALTPGRYEYRFVVDGQWINDPRAKERTPNPFGGDNSVLVVDEPARAKGLRMLW